MKSSKLDIKERAYKFALRVIKFLESLPYERTTKILENQILKSSTSIEANIIETQAGSSKKDFTNFLNHALKSANETKFCSGLLRDSGKGDKETLNSLLKVTKELSNILGSSTLKLKSKIY